jgi:Arc/MetJ family transcription regulator
MPADIHDVAEPINCTLELCNYVHSEGFIVSTTQIELDQELLDQAASILGTTTKKATVNEALRRVVQAETRRRHLEELAAGALPDLSDPDIMQAAWR